MNRIMGVVATIVAMAAALGVADRKPIREVDTELLTRETQRNIEPSPGMNLVWWITPEFWEASLVGEQNITPGDREAIVSALREYVVVAVVRADVDDFGAFTYHTKEATQANLKAAHAALDRSPQPLELVELDAINPNARSFIGSMKPILTAAMGDLGRNCHFFTFKNTDEHGSPIVSGYQSGRLIIDLAPTPGETGGTATFNTPLDSLHVPRTCAACSAKAHITWKFCPMCGKALE